MPRKGYVFDLDGVIWLGDSPVPGASRAVEALRARGFRTLFCTNNSTLHRRDVAAKLARVGIETPLEDVVSAGSMAATVLREREGAPPVFLIGEQGLRAELEEGGIPLTERPSEAAWVVVGLDRQITFERLRQAHRAIVGGARFLATNPDTLLPETDGGSCPGCGALTALLERSTGVRPLCYGKPDPSLFAHIARRHGWGAEEMAAVGDRLDTDILAANRFGCLSILVLTGCTSRAEALAAPRDVAPGVILDSLWPGLPELAESADTLGPGRRTN